jgi:hypothetical protein
MHIAAASSSNEDRTTLPNSNRRHCFMDDLRQECIAMRTGTRGEMLSRERSGAGGKPAESRLP